MLMCKEGGITSARRAAFYSSKDSRSVHVYVSPSKSRTLYP